MFMIQKIWPWFLPASHIIRDQPRPPLGQSMATAPALPAMPEHGDFKWNLSHSGQYACSHVLLCQHSCPLSRSALLLAHMYSDSSAPRSRTWGKIRPPGQRNRQGIGHKYCRGRGMRQKRKLSLGEHVCSTHSNPGLSVSRGGTNLTNAGIFMDKKSTYSVVYDSKKKKKKAWK